MSHRTRTPLAAALTWLLAVIGGVAPMISPATRADRLGDDSTVAVPASLRAEARPRSCRKVPPSPSCSAEFADIDEEDSDEEKERDEGQVPNANFAGIPPRFGPANRPGRSEWSGAPLPPPAPLFLLCGRLVC